MGGHGGTTSQALSLQSVILTGVLSSTQIKHERLLYVRPHGFNLFQATMYSSGPRPSNMPKSEMQFRPCWPAALDNR